MPPVPYPPSIQAICKWYCCNREALTSSTLEYSWLNYSPREYSVSDSVSVSSLGIKTPGMLLLGVLILLLCLPPPPHSPLLPPHLPSPSPSPGPRWGLGPWQGLRPKPLNYAVVRVVHPLPAGSRAGSLPSGEGTAPPGDRARGGWGACRTEEGGSQGRAGVARDSRPSRVYVSSLTISSAAVS